MPGQFRELRRKKQELSKEECERILRECRRGVLSVNGDDGYPYCLTVNFYYEDGKIYIHGSRTGYKIDSIRRDDRVCFTVHDEGYHKDDWSLFVNSVIVFGRAELVEDESVTVETCRRLGLKYYPNRDDVEEELRKDVSRVQMICIHIEHMCGKLVHEK